MEVEIDMEIEIETAKRMRKRDRNSIIEGISGRITDRYTNRDKFKGRYRKGNIYIWQR